MQIRGAFVLFALWCTPFVAGQIPEPTGDDGGPTSSVVGDPEVSGPPASEDVPPTSTTPEGETTTRPGSGGGGTGSVDPPDVHLVVPELSVGRIELEVDQLRADINLNAEVARLVELNAGIQIAVDKVNITIDSVEAELELEVRLGQLVQIVNRTLSSLDLNPALINLIGAATDIVEGVIGAVDGLLGSITQGDTTLRFLIDNLGNIVQETVSGGGDAVSSIIGNYRQNMTFTGAEKMLEGGLMQRSYEYSPLNALVNIVFNSLGQIVQAQVVRGGGTGEGEEEEEEEDQELPTGVPEPSATAV